MAAGGFKIFTTGEVLTSADTNNFLMQGVLVFADAAARDAAITAPEEGQACYLKDTDAVLTYSGSTWVGFDDSNAIQNAIVDAKGDLISATANDTPARLAVGANNSLLVADSVESTGLKWLNNWVSYTPILTGITIGNGTLVSKFFRIGKMVTVRVALTLGSTTSIGADNFIQLPFSFAGGDQQIAPISYGDSGTSQFMGFGSTIFGDTIRLLCINAGTAFGNAALVNSTTPFTWATNDEIKFVFTYEVA